MLKQAISTDGESRAERQIGVVLQKLGYHLRVSIESADVQRAVRHVHANIKKVDNLAETSQWLVHAASQVGIRIVPVSMTRKDLWNIVAEGYPVIYRANLEGDNQWWLFESVSGGKLDAEEIRDEAQPARLSKSDLDAVLNTTGECNCFVAQSSFEIQTSASRWHLNFEHAESGPRGVKHKGVGYMGGEHSQHGHVGPLQRILRLLRLETRDIATLILFAVVAGVLNLATPLAVESLVNTVAWGNYVQPLLVLALALMVFLGFAGILKALQALLVEILQRRLMVRMVGDFAYRFPAARREALAGRQPAELVNRYFDIMTIQKAMAMVLLDGMSIVLTTTIGLFLLAFYHPFLLGFDLILLMSMTSVTYLLGRGAVDTALNESIVKYRIAHWLQDVLSWPTAFKIHGGAALATDRTNRLTVEYLMARRQHFAVLFRQMLFALALQAIASAALLGVGGWLVIKGELTLGQLVASELVVTAIVGAFAKIGKSLETYYDLLAAVDKVGHLLDIPTDPPERLLAVGAAPARVRWENLPLPAVHVGVPHNAANMTIEPGERVAITGAGGCGKTWLLELLAGLHQSDQGFAEIGGVDVRQAALACGGSLIALAGEPQIFHGTLLENIILARPALSVEAAREALNTVGLWDAVLKLPAGVDTMLQTGGYPLSGSQRAQLMLARAIVSRPRVLLIDGLLDWLATVARHQLWTELSQADQPWTILITSHDIEIIRSCSKVIALD